jgi:predicted nucleic acid-binding protein
MKLFVQEAGTEAIIRLMEATEDNRKLISAGTPLEVYAALKRRERTGGIGAEDSGAARTILRVEAARMVQQPLNPAVLEAARQLIDHHELRSTEALQLGAAIVAREMFQGMDVIFVSSDERLLEAARGERFETMNPLLEPAGEATPDQATTDQATRDQATRDEAIQH